MSPQEKANYLIARFANFFPCDGYENALGKECALVCIDEIINSQKAWGINLFWEDVKTEIQKL